MLQRILTVLVLIAAPGTAADDLQRLRPYAVASEQNLLRQEHLYTTSGSVSVGYRLERFAVARIVAPARPRTGWARRARSRSRPCAEGGRPLTAWLPLDRRAREWLDGA
jgi:hypothetical protein